MHAYTKRLSQSLRLEDFTVVRQLGKGKFGKVSLVVHNSTGFLCAMKAIEKDTIRKENLAGQLAR
jgi:aurora kinase